MLEIWRPHQHLEPQYRLFSLLMSFRSFSPHLVALYTIQTHLNHITLYFSNSYSSLNFTKIFEIVMLHHLKEMCFLSFHVYHIKAQAQGKSVYLFLWNGRDFSCYNQADYKTKKTFEQGLKGGDRCMLTQTAHPNQGRCLSLTKQLMNKQLLCRYIGATS